MSALSVASDAPTCVLRLFEIGQKERCLTWDDAHQTPDLAEVRAFFEGAGHLAFALAAAYRKRAAQLFEQGRMEHGLSALRAGIDALGNRHRSPAVIDDTGMKLILGTQNLKQGKLDVARALLQGVLDSRLANYRSFIAPP